MKTELLIALFICHWLADYTYLSTAWMLNAKRLGKPLFPIFIHASIHTLLMSLVLMFFTNNIELILKLSMLQLFTHFIIDVWKGKMNAWFPKLQSPTNKWHWIIFGFDQLLHTLVIIIMTSYI